MPDNTSPSPLRGVLCSHSNAVRAARSMRGHGIETTIVATGDPMQPWLVVEATTATHEDACVCA